MPLTDPAILRSEDNAPELIADDEGNRGQVADGVTPLLFRLVATDLGGLDPGELTFEVEIVSGGTVAGGLVLNAIPGDANEWFLHLHAVDPANLNFVSAGDDEEMPINQLEARVVVKDGAGVTVYSAPNTFQIRKPPVVLISSQTFSFAVQDEVEELRGGEFIRVVRPSLDDPAPAILAAISPLHTNWAVTRPDWNRTGERWAMGLLGDGGGSVRSLWAEGRRGAVHGCRAAVPR